MLSWFWETQGDNMSFGCGHGCRRDARGLYAAAPVLIIWSSATRHPLTNQKLAPEISTPTFRRLSDGHRACMGSHVRTTVCRTSNAGRYHIIRAPATSHTVSVAGGFRLLGVNDLLTATLLNASFSTPPCCEGVPVLLWVRERVDTAGDTQRMRAEHAPPP